MSLQFFVTNLRINRFLILVFDFGILRSDMDLSFMTTVYSVYEGEREVINTFGIQPLKRGNTVLSKKK